MQEKVVGVLFGMEDHFPWALINRINDKNESGVRAEAVRVSHVEDRAETPYAVIVDRISHDVPFYRTFLKCVAASGATIINNPFWWSADDKFFDNLVAKSVDVAVPRTVLLPHKQHPPNTKGNSFRNLEFVDWERVFDFLGFPIFLKPAYGGGWKDVYKCDDRAEFFSSYDQTRDLCMMAQEAIDFTDYFRCYVIGRKHVKVMAYDPRRQFHERYIRDYVSEQPGLLEKIERDALELCRALGYDMNTVELAVRDGVPYAIDFMNPAPDADPFSVGEENFEWVVETVASVCIERALDPPGYEPTGSWPEALGAKKKRGRGGKKRKEDGVKKAPATRKKSSSRKLPGPPGREKE